jgi:hypothetical protein
MHDLTAAHWIYLIGVIVILATMLTRKNIIVPAVTFTFLTALVFSHSLVGGLSAIFNASLVAAQELFSIFLIIALVTGMLGALQALGSDKKMVAPFKPVMRNGHLSFWTLAAVTYMISLFFWPTPAVPLIGAVLIPVAIRAGLRPMAVAFTIAIAGQGMALSSDFVIRVAPGLSATAAGANPDTVANRAMVLSLIVGFLALGIGYVLEFRKMRTPSDALLEEWESTTVGPTDGDDLGGLGGSPTIGHGTAIRREADAVKDDDLQHHDYVTSSMHAAEAHGHLAGAGTATAERTEAGVATAEALVVEEVQPKVAPWITTTFAVAVPLAYLALIIYLIYGMATKGSGGGLKGGDAAALVGGIAAITIFLASLAEGRSTFLERSAEHVVDGLVFAFKAMGVVLPIAGFFFIGNGDFSGRILGIAPGADGAAAGPAFLFDLVLHGEAHLPQNAVVTALGVLVIGMIAGLEGSGFSGLPLTGSLAGTLGPATGVDPATLAAIGQMGNIWSGGGTLVAWSSLIAVAGFARVSVIELARMCFIPVVVGLVVATVAAVAIFG